MTLILLAVALGLDSFRATVGLGALRPPLAYALRLAGVFAIVEAATPLVGIVVGGAVAPLLGVVAPFAGPAVLAATGGYVIVEAIRGRDGTDLTVARGHALTWGLPLSLSLDNLVAGAGVGLIGADPLPASLFIGLVSGALAFAGLQVGALVPRFVPVRGEIVAGTLLIASAGAALWTGATT